MVAMMQPERKNSASTYLTLTVTKNQEIYTFDREIMQEQL